MYHVRMHCTCPGLLGLNVWVPAASKAARFFDELRILTRFVQPQLEDAQAEAKTSSDAFDMMMFIERERESLHYYSTV